MNETQLPNTPVHKIGAVASISGVPTPTLRIWEIRYGTFTPNKTLSNHRLYTDDDVLKATLLKRLTEHGHGISNIAKHVLDLIEEAFEGLLKVVSKKVSK